MTIAGACILPSAPLLVPGVAAAVPDGVDAVCDALDIVVERLPDADVAVVLAAGADWAVHCRADVDLAGIGRGDIRRAFRTDSALAAELAMAIGAPTVESRITLDHAVLLLLLGSPPPVVCVTVPASAPFAALMDAGEALATPLSDPELSVLVTVPGDLSAGLSARAPLALVDGAQDFDAQVVEAVDAARLDVLARLGPEEAQRVGARAWAPLGVLHGMLRHSKLGLVRRCYAAPCGVGYLVAHGS